MDPQVVAAIIAAGVSALTLVGTLAAQYFGRRATSRDTEKTLEEQRKHLDLTLAEQSRQLDRTLDEQRARTLNERFASAAEQLGGDKPAAVRLAGVYAMAGLADDWESNRQTCVDVLCAYLRMPYEPEPSEGASVKDQVEFKANREVRHTVIRVITAHIQEGAAMSWKGLNLDFTEAVFDGGNFRGAQFSGGMVSFRGAEFGRSTVDFSRARFSGGLVDFWNARFSGGEIKFNDTRFADGQVNFVDTQFSGAIVHFWNAQFSGGTVKFSHARLSDGAVHFGHAQFSGGMVSFNSSHFSGGTVDFVATQFCGGIVQFGGSRFSGGTVDFLRAQFSGSTIDFLNAQFSGGAVDFSTVATWSHPPNFPWANTPAVGVKLPRLPDQKQWRN